MTDPRPLKNRAVWNSKPALRLVFQDYYRLIAAACRQGPTLEVGGGSGNLKEYLPQSVSTDILATPWLDAVADAQAIPFRDAAFANLVVCDALHHFIQPQRFFDEALRILKPGGRLVLLEPAATPVSRLVGRLAHSEEGIDMSADPLPAGADLPARRDPFEANVAIPTLLFFGRDHERFQKLYPQFRIIQRRWLALFAYPLTGGFHDISFLPALAVRPLLAIERLLLPLLGPLMAFRMFVVLERR